MAGITPMVVTIAVAKLIPGKEEHTMGKNQHVTYRPDGDWQVKGEGNRKATAVTTTQKDAIKIARDIAINQGSEVVIHNRNGKIRDKNSYGNDPYPPEG